MSLFVSGPIRADLLSAERLELKAESIGRDRVVEGKVVDASLLGRVRDNGRVLLRCYRALAAVIEEERATTPAAEWLVDNFHIVEDVLNEIRTALPPGFYRQLPRLGEGPFTGSPRVVGLASTFVAHTDSRFDPLALQRFVLAFQRVQPLQISELWAVPIALRLTLVENLRRLAEEIVEGRADRLAADRLADILLGQGEGPPDPLAFRSLGDQVLSTPFAVQLAQRLRDQDPDATPAARWLEERLATVGTSSQELVRAEHQRQGAANVSVRNVITSLRVMGTFDWHEFFESVSLVDRVLREESAFGAMDFATRDRYRHGIEDLARGSGRTEMDVARQALALAGGREDPGHYLISKGRPRLEESLDYRTSVRQRLVRAYMASATWSYLGSTFIVTAFLLWSPLFFTHHLGVSTALLVVLGALAIFPASDAATALINRAMMELLPPRPLPRLELARGVPPELKALVVVPTLLTDEAQIAEQISRLGVHYLANSDGALRFALLSDWTDAPGEHAPRDDALLAAARAGIDALNRQYGAAAGGEPRFYLFHRRRVWSAGEGTWMGWERKRGKLHELNRLLRGAADTTFLTAPAPSSVPEDIRYVITLDADTHLPRGAAARLVGTLAHPLNRARLDPRERRVVEGYGILQPRIAPTLPTDREGSIYQRISSGPAGIDPYASAVSDVYQDLFGEGSYTGKGIYDVDAFESALAGRVPEGALLSHDLFEGLFARAGLVSDIELFEEFPARYEVAAARQHRWARGDWQLLPWILRGAAGRGAARGSITPIGRWKMFDNLRRTLSAPAAYLTLLVGWTLPDGVALIWTKFVLLAIAIPAFIPVSTEILPQRPGISKRAYLRSVAGSLLLAIAQVTLSLVLLAHQAWLMADAVVRTLARLLFTRRRLLEWVSAAQVKSSSTLELRSVYARMAGAPVLALIAGVVAMLAPGAHWILAVPLVTFWLLSPAVARWISLPPRARPAEQLSPGERETLRATARRSWRFFETFVTAAENAVPPDNFQEDPRPVVARRTSPTNIGLYLLSTVSARDFGWLGTLDMADRLEATLGTLDRLERFRGHYYNWYDTGDLRPLEPRYVSTVDSGNLAGHLCVLAVAARERTERPFVEVEAAGGIVDALRLVAEAAPLTPGGAAEPLRAAVERLIERLATPPVAAGEWEVRLRALASDADGLTALAEGLEGESRGPALAWVKTVQATITAHRRDLEALAPWAEPLEALAASVPDGMLAGREAVARLRSTIPALRDMPACAEAAAQELVELLAAGRGQGAGLDAGRVGKVIEAIERSGLAAAALVRRLEEISRAARELFEAMHFGFLYDESRHLFTIGYRVSDGSLDGGRYDLLASEARLTSFIAVARGDVPASHWFRLGRPMTPVELGTALLSWSGSMFEYLMPGLVMRTPAGSLLDQTSRLVVQRQKAYALAHAVPWGISESAYNVRDLDLTYQYSSFGVPGLGLERGLGEDLVIAPYATALAAMVDPPAAARNFTELARVGGLGAYGFYEALDYTRSRVPEGTRVAVIRAYMAHHQGMTVVALANVLLDGRMRERFHAEPIVQATELLLQERPPHDVPVMRPRSEEVSAPGHLRESVAPVARRFTSASDPLPRTHLLSNGRYVVMLTAAGGGYSHCGPLAVTRWREDVTRDAWGSFVFLRDVLTGQVWSTGYQPSGVEPQAYAATFLEDRAEIQRRDGNLFTTLEVLVSPEDDAEIRRVSLTNVGKRRPGDRADVLRRAGAGAPAGGPGASRLLQPVRAHRGRRRAGHAPGHAPEPRPRGAARLGRPRGDGGGRDRGRLPARDGPRPLPRPGARHPDADVDDRGPAALEHHRRGARPHLQPPPARAAGAGRERAHRVHDPARPLAGGRAGPGRQVPRPRDVRAHGHAGVDAGAGPAPSPRHRARRGPPLPARGQSHPVLRSASAGPGAHAGTELGRSLRALGAPDLRRPAHRPGPDRRGGGPRHRAADPARPRILAHEGAGGGSRHPQREAAVVSPGSPGHARGPGAGGEAHAHRDPRGRRVRPPDRPPLPGGA